MKITLREWHPNDAISLAKILNNLNVLKNLRNGIPYPYTENDAVAYISAILAINSTNDFAYAFVQMMY